MLIVHGDKCAGASIAASIGTLAIAFANQTNGAPGDGAPAAAIENDSSGLVGSDLPMQKERPSPDSDLG